MKSIFTKALFSKTTIFLSGGMFTHFFYRSIDLYRNSLPASHYVFLYTVHLQVTTGTLVLVLSPLTSSSPSSSSSWGAEVFALSPDFLDLSVFTTVSSSSCASSLSWYTQKQITMARRKTQTPSDASESYFLFFLSCKNNINRLLILTTENLSCRDCNSCWMASNLCLSSLSCSNSWSCSCILAS